MYFLHHPSFMKGSKLQQLYVSKNGIINEACNLIATYTEGEFFFDQILDRW